jgi:NADPH-dependent 2,4-dienoyl-CoA reductase/sulfur reductase-like enzyme/nitrite reductase/ring-hydroxylating ferredoxin subunit
MDETPKLDLKRGLPVRDLPAGKSVFGQLDGEDLIVTRSGDEFFAVSAFCTHYHGPLADGLVVGETVRCPWHHACFSLRTGEALAAPALDAISCWQVRRDGDTLFVGEKLPESPPTLIAPSLSRNLPASIFIVGGGAAGLAAADMLRRDGYPGPITMLTADDSPPYDRPNLSKDFLTGTAAEDWIPLRPANFYKDRDIDLQLNSRVGSLDPAKKQLHLENGREFEFGALLLSTGADPIKLKIEGATAFHPLYLRTFADSKAILARAASAKRVVVIGASFIGLEVAAALRSLGIEVDVVALEREPLERVMGVDVGHAIRKLHESHGVHFHLEQSVNRLEGRRVTLSGGKVLEADFVVAGAGVRPSVSLAEQAGLAMDRGICVDPYLETSVPGIFAAGDIARWPDPHSGDRIRVEHWVVAERQGQVAAKNMLGHRVRFEAVPFFWSQHYDVVINYLGHAENPDSVQIDGRLDAHDCTLRYLRGARTLAVATIFRDLQNLQMEAAMEAEISPRP